MAGAEPDGGWRWVTGEDWTFTAWYAPGEPNEILPTANYYFMFVSTFFIAAAGTWVTEKVVIPRLGHYSGDEKPEEIRKLSPEEKKGLKFAAFSFLVFTLIILYAPNMIMIIGRYYYHSL